MPRSLSYTERALADLDSVRRWLTQPGAGPTARRKLTAIWAAIERLTQTPCLHNVCEHDGVREMPCAGGYRVLYRVDLDTGMNETAGDVRVLRVFGPGQDRTRP